MAELPEAKFGATAICATGIRGNHAPLIVPQIAGNADADITPCTDELRFRHDIDFPSISFSCSSIFICDLANNPLMENTKLY